MIKLRLCSRKSVVKTLFLLLLLLLLAACGGGEADEPVEEVGDSATSDVDNTTDSEAIEDGDIGATGSEEDSGELPPTPQPGGKVETVRTTPDPASAELIAANPTALTNRIEAEETAVSLDIALLIDSTGSMAAEFANLQASLPHLVATLTTLSETVNLRLGLVAYNDQGKLGAVQVLDFTEDSAIFVEAIGNLTAVGGGDYPEALAEGLNRAMFDLNWRTESRKLLILIGDAPPQPSSNFADMSQQAAAQNITIFTIGSDGLDEAGAAIFDQIAQTGNGRFFYITDTPENSPAIATAVYPPSQITHVFSAIVGEVLDAQAP